MKQLLIILLSFFAIHCHAQSIVNATGGTATLSGNTYSYSVGEMCAVHTSSTATLVVTQGLLQPSRSRPDAVNESWLQTDNITAYPNPSTSIINIELSTQQAADASFILLDMQGRKLLSRTAQVVSGMNKYKFDLTAYANSYYVLQVLLNKSDNTYSQSFKIQKIN